MLVVLDANVFVSAAIQRGARYRIVQSWLAGGASFEVVMCPALLDEIREVLTDRPRLRKWISLETATRFTDTMRNLLAAANHRHRQVIAALIRTIFAQPDTKTATAQLRAVVDQLRPYAPAVAERLEQMETDLLAYAAFPVAHWSKIWSNNPIERLNRELKRRTDVVGIFPDKASVIRLVGALLVEINDEMIAAERRYIAGASVADLTNEPAELSLPAAPRT